MQRSPSDVHFRLLQKMFTLWYRQRDYVYPLSALVSPSDDLITVHPLQQAQCHTHHFCRRVSSMFVPK